MLKYLRPALGLTIVMTLLTGLVYPLAMTGIAQAVFPEQADGSLVSRDGNVVGSRLIGQPFAKDGYFHPRPSAAGEGYAADNSSGSNLGPTSHVLIEAVRDRAQVLNGQNAKRPVPIDLVTASGSGLDPHISPQAAAFQVSRVATARGLPEARLRDLVGAHIERRTAGFLGEPRINVLSLNMALDELENGRGAR